MSNLVRLASNDYRDCETTNFIVFSISLSNLMNYPRHVNKVIQSFVRSFVSWLVQSFVRSTPSFILNLNLILCKATTRDILDCEQSLFFSGIVVKCVILITWARARNEGASPRSYFSGLRPRSLLSFFASPLAAREIEIARSTIPKKNNDFSQSRDICAQETNGRSVGR